MWDHIMKDEIIIYVTSDGLLGQNEEQAWAELCQAQGQFGFAWFG